MSVFTTQLRYYAEQSVREAGKWQDGMLSKDIIREFRPLLFNFNYPLSERVNKEEWEEDFIRHFYFWELGAETVSQWKIFLQDWLNTNMDFYNHQIDAYYQKWDYWNNYNYDESFKHKKEQDDKIGEGQGTAYGKAYSDQKQVFGNTAARTKEDDKTENDTKSDERHQDHEIDHSMTKYYDTPSKNIEKIDDHLNNATQVDAKKDTNGESDQKGNSLTDFDGSIRQLTGDDNFTDNVGRERGDSVTNRNREEKHGEQVKDATHKVGRQNASIGNLISDYVNAIQNVKREILMEMECLFMGVW